MARRRIFIEEIRKYYVYFEDEEASAGENKESGSRDNKESGEPQILRFIKRHFWSFLFAILASLIASIIAALWFAG